MRVPLDLSVAAVALIFLFPGTGWCEVPDPDLSYAEKTLRESRIAVDGSSLIKFFQARTLSPADRKKLGDLVPLLGDEEFSVREETFKKLQASGRAALPFLREAAASTDPEIAGSAARLIRELSSNADQALTIAAAHMLAKQRPEGTVETLLAFAPETTDESVQEAVLNALAQVGLAGGKVHPSLVAALRSGNPAQRMAAAFVHGQGGSEARLVLKPLLRDKDASVRYQAAAALVKAGDKQAVSVLVDLLGDRSPLLPWLAEELLFRIAGDKAPPATLDDTERGRRSCREAWAAWWKENERKTDLKKVNYTDTYLGLTLICDCDKAPNSEGWLWETGPDGKERWHFSGVRVITDVQLLPGRRLLLAEGANNQVTERDRDGKILWSHRTNGYATTVLRLPGGNTLIGGYNAIQEVTPKGKVAFSYGPTGGSLYRVKRLRTGNLLFASNGQVVEIDRTGKQVRTVNIPGGTGIWAHVELLPNGHFLVAQYSANKVIELDAAGKVHWQLTVTTPSSASRLPNGNILVSSMDARKVVIFNRAGKEVWSVKSQGRPFLARRH